MSFSTDLDAARERAGLPVVHRLKCDCGVRFITTDHERAEGFGELHWEMTPRHTGTWVTGPGRFRIKRAKSEFAPWLWIVRDAERPRAFGFARTHAAAVELVGAMYARPGRHVQVLDDDDEVVAYVPGTLSGSPTATEWLHELEAAREFDDDDDDWRDL